MVENKLEMSHLNFRALITFLRQLALGAKIQKYFSAAKICCKCIQTAEIRTKDVNKQLISVPNV